MELANWYSVAKALHLVGMVSWMAGMFYLVRIMVNHAMAFDRPEPERSILATQFTVMEWKSYNVILKPAVIITWSFGVIMLCINPFWLSQGWLNLKLLFDHAYRVYALPEKPYSATGVWQFPLYTYSLPRPQ